MTDFVRNQFGRVPLAVKKDEPFDVLSIGLFCADTEMFEARDGRDLVEHSPSSHEVRPPA